MRCGGGQDILKSYFPLTFCFSPTTVCGKGVREMRWRQDIFFSRTVCGNVCVRCGGVKDTLKVSLIIFFFLILVGFPSAFFS